MPLHPPSRPSSAAFTHSRAQAAAPSTTPASTSTSASIISASSMSASKARQYAHLHAQLVQLNAHLADTDNLVRMTSAQAGDMRFLGGYVGGLFMGAAKVLGEEGIDKTGGNAKE
ncbi:hypothetical protein CPC735_012050 [Coccidioides posadasii C735 delta SOWgp]|uniref:DASH complex subunit Hsk3 like-domain-containing protein n=1 Tax=Coccidioides posadasii (strain C735) TaxID=222929 RepID=C5NZJ4_COCP7|nr:hypothetical protein CPC735_012050 [Coccidioides posadasii C735 delta SOWgp]EER29887.1 hypothetical protein CPC735_012050 [Coccidioides posadasii C735 delta SOWgp]|eukprot:XP_003072032.1 hypothetical protein CPC735_012050 [Coccidioides posadasii C735 delta SOWgp]